jgi:hypothetical protein
MRQATKPTAGKNEPSTAAETMRKNTKPQCGSMKLRTVHGQGFPPAVRHQSCCVFHTFPFPAGPQNWEKTKAAHDIRRLLPPFESTEKRITDALKKGSCANSERP